MAGARLAMRCRDEFMQDAAFAGHMIRITTAAQFGKLSLQRAHGFESRAYPRQLTVDESIYIATVPVRPVREFKQPSHIGQ